MVEADKLILKFIWLCKELRISKEISKMRKVSQLKVSSYMRVCIFQNLQVSTLKNYSF